MSLAKAASICIDTDGQFHVQNFDSLEQAENDANISSESGLPAIAISREEFVQIAISHAARIRVGNMAHSENLQKGKL